MEIILKYSCLVVLDFLILHGQLIKKISLFYTCQFIFLPRNQNVIKYHKTFFPCVARMNKKSLLMRINPTPSVIMPTTHWRCQLGQLQDLGQRSLKKHWMRMFRTYGENRPRGVWDMNGAWRTSFNSSNLGPRRAQFMWNKGLMCPAPYQSC